MTKMFKISSLVLAGALLLTVVAVPTASAVTIDELMAQIATLTAQLNALKGTTAVSSATFTRDLTVGSKGDDVSALQQVLVDGGYLNIVAPTGYFGAMTKAALAKYQAANGIAPAIGYFGPKTRAAMSVVSTVPGTTPGTTPVVVADGTDGSITAADAAYVSSGATFKKGDTQNIYDVRLSATGGKVAVTRLDVKFSERPWLTLSKLVLKDTTGTVIAEKTLSSAADATEVTVGSDYRVRFENFNYVVTPGTDATLVVSATSMAASDKITTQTVTVSIPASAIRTVNGKGYTESIGSITAKTFVFSSTGSTADLNTSISPDSPAKKYVTTSTSVTPDVVLGIYRLKAVNNGATISSLMVLVKSTTGVATSTLLSNLRLVDTNGTTYGAASLNGATTFTNMNIKLAKDTWKDLTLKADIAASQSLSASTTLVASSVVGIDDNYNTLTLTNASNVTANDVVFSTGNLELVGPSAVLGADVASFMCNASSTCISAKNVTYTFTLKNNSNINLYASSTIAQLVATSSTGSFGDSTISSSTMQSLSVSPATVSGDDTATIKHYIIPAGSSRTFTLTGLIGRQAGTASAYSELKITGINFGGTTIAISAIDFGLEALKAGLTL